MSTNEEGKTRRREVEWIGSSRRDLKAFPEPMQQAMGFELYLIQGGAMPRNAKPFKGVGSGVIEIALRHADGAFRTVIAVQLGEKIYVLHAFQKKSKRGIATPRYDVELIKHRYEEARERASRG